MKFHELSIEQFFIFHSPNGRWDGFRKVSEDGAIFISNKGREHGIPIAFEPHEEVWVYA
jgi:hypothetical protein